MHMLVSMVVSLLSFLVLQNALADASVKQRLANKVKAIFPGIEVTEVNPAPIAGLYEVLVGTEVIYVTTDGHFLLRGDLLDLDEGRNLSEERRGQARLNALKSLGFNTMIEFAPENAKHVIYVYTDVDCSYCRKFHQEIGTLNKAGIAVRYLAFPRAGIGSESYRKSMSVWCAKDRNTALTNAKAGKEIPPATCNNPVKRHYQMGQAMGVRGTPTIILEDGEQIGGYIPAERLVQYIAGNRR